MPLTDREEEKEKQRYEFWIAAFLSALQGSGSGENDIDVIVGRAQIIADLALRVVDQEWK